MVARIGMLEKWNIGIRGLINDPAHASNF